MPTSEYRARRLLKSGKAVKHSFDPFTIRLTEREDGNVQPVEVSGLQQMDASDFYRVFDER